MLASGQPGRDRMKLLTDARSRKLTKALQAITYSYTFPRPPATMPCSTLAGPKMFKLATEFSSMMALEPSSLMCAKSFCSAEFCCWQLGFVQDGMGVETPCRGHRRVGGSSPETTTSQIRNKHESENKAALVTSQKKQEENRNREGPSKIPLNLKPQNIRMLRVPDSRFSFPWTPGGLEQ